jgi:flavin reductase (DIM6/NTAB) family NADH-FMN oxidoreductase RutF
MLKSIGAKPLVFTTPAWVVGTYDEAGKANVMTASWGGICCSTPPCVNVCLRKATYTYGCLLARKAFTINVPSQRLVRETDFFGRASGRKTDKLGATGLTAGRSNLVDAPYIEGFPLILECALRHTLEIGLHTLFVGEIMDIKAASEVLDEKGRPDPEKVQPFSYAPEIGRYHALGLDIGEAGALGRSFDT